MTRMSDLIAGMRIRLIQSIGKSCRRLSVWVRSGRFSALELKALKRLLQTL
jgi:hypothetical protein